MRVSVVQVNAGSMIAARTAQAGRRVGGEVADGLGRTTARADMPVRERRRLV